MSIDLVAFNQAKVKLISNSNFKTETLFFPPFKSDLQIPGTCKKSFPNGQLFRVILSCQGQEKMSFSI